MKLTDKIQKALNFSASKHNGQMRKSSGYPYIVHPFSVALILSEYVYDEDIIVAGLLHDVIEDMENYRYDDLKKDFGKKVADIVLGVSEDRDRYNVKSDEESWQERKEEYLKNLKNDTEESLLVCAADKIHNLKSMSRIYEQKGDEMWEDFNAPVDRQVWYYNEILKILREKLQNDIIIELEREFKNFKTVIGLETVQISTQNNKGKNLLIR